MILFDGVSEPSLRDYLGRSLATATHASFALRRVRLARVDFMPDELRDVGSCRVLLGRLDADTLASPGVAPTAASARTAALLDMAASGRLEIRSAPLLAWDPDFAILRRADRDALLFGSIQFASTLPRRAIDEVALACVVHDADAVRLAAARFEELWQRAHDTLEAVTDALCRTRSLVDG